MNCTPNVFWQFFFFSLDPVTWGRLKRRCSETDNALIPKMLSWLREQERMIWCQAPCQGPVWPCIRIQPAICSYNSKHCALIKKWYWTGANNKSVSPIKVHLKGILHPLNLLTEGMEVIVVLSWKAVWSPGAVLRTDPWSSWKTVVWGLLPLNHGAFHIMCGNYLCILTTACQVTWLVHLPHYFLF